jgi:tetratricopeptide (TPR) repeat protein
MRAKRGPAILCCCLLGISALTACGGPSGEDREARTHAVVADAEWKWLQQARRDLEAKRAALSAAEEEARKSGKAPAAVPAVQALAADVRTHTEELRRRLLGFINDNPPPAGEKPSGRALEAIRLKSDEDILIAREHMEQGGDYRRAIDIYEAALAVDPDNPRLKEEMERAQAKRYMTQERFARVQPGMTPDQVRSLLGAPNVNDIREYPQRGVTGWFYAKDSRGAAAAVWFKTSGDRQTVYEADFDALPAAPP